MARFEIAYERTGGHEGHYSNVAADRGGETWVGIARKVWPLWSGWSRVDAHKKDKSGQALVDAMLCDAELGRLVKEFYFNNFWSHHSLDAVPQALADKIFDMAVNCGVNTAGRIVQRMLNFGNRNGRDYADLKVDGHMGTVTVAALNKVVALRGLPLVCGALVCEHYTTYKAIVEKDPGQEVFWWGWLKRNLSYL